jgi:hypothetical protein
LVVSSKRPRKRSVAALAQVPRCLQYEYPSTITEKDSCTLRSFDQDPTPYTTSIAEDARTLIFPLGSVPRVVQLPDAGSRVSANSSDAFREIEREREAYAASTVPGSACSLALVAVHEQTSCTVSDINAATRTMVG